MMQDQNTSCSTTIFYKATSYAAEVFRIILTKRTLVRNLFLNIALLYVTFEMVLTMDSFTLRYLRDGLDHGFSEVHQLRQRLKQYMTISKQLINIIRCLMTLL